MGLPENVIFEQSQKKAPGTDDFFCVSIWHHNSSRVVHCVVIPYALSNGYQLFGGIYICHLQGFLECT